LHPLACIVSSISEESKNLRDLCSLTFLIRPQQALRATSNPFTVTLGRDTSLESWRRFRLPIRKHNTTSDTIQKLMFICHHHHHVELETRIGTSVIDIG